MAEVIADHRQDSFDGVVGAADQVIAAHPVVVLQVADSGFDRRSTVERAWPQR
ncbi:MAG: hypothetical protein JO209_07350 [Acidisphaera sp.]|nr:hypothetical protein [Acidisphaera sp.]